MLLPSAKKTFIFFFNWRILQVKIGPILRIEIIQLFYRKRMTWIEWFCSLAGNEGLCIVPQDFISMHAFVT
jgi:hypothetical protein